MAVDKSDRMLHAKLRRNGHGSRGHGKGIGLNSSALFCQCTFFCFSALGIGHFQRAVFEAVPIIRGDSQRDGFLKRRKAFIGLDRSMFDGRGYRYGIAPFRFQLDIFRDRSIRKIKFLLLSAAGGGVIPADEGNIFFGRIRIRLHGLFTRCHSLRSDRAAAVTVEGHRICFHELRAHRHIRARHGKGIFQRVCRVLREFGGLFRPVIIGSGQSAGFQDITGFRSNGQR